MNRILVLGCGELAWGRPSQSALFGRQWTRGRLSEKIGLGVEGPLTGTTAGLDWVTLADEVERQRAWRPKVPLESAPNLLFRKAQPAKSSLLPTWQELARSQALWATRELGGVGVLVTPKEWRESIAGRQLLAAWASEGWSWATLEQVLRKRYSAGTRCVSASGLWVRVLEREGGCTFANGPEAARALELASAILDRAMEQLSPELAGRWRREEESASGWYVHQQLARRIAQALKEGKTTVDLADSTDSGSPSGVLFRFSSHEAQDRYRALSALRVKVVLPAAALPWWDKVSQPNLLFSPEGVAHSGVRWEERKTVLLEGAESRQLAGYLSFHGLEREEVDPARLEEALELGSPLPPLLEEAEGRAPASSAKVAIPLSAPPTSPAAEPAPPKASAPEPAVVTNVGPPSVELSPPGPVAVTRSAPPAASQLVPEPKAQEEEDLLSSAATFADDEPIAEIPVALSDESDDKLTALPTFQPQTFSLADVQHRPDRVRVWLDGSRVEPANVRRSTRHGVYTIEGIPVPHGAIVRIDFEPPQD